MHSIPETSLPAKEQLDLFGGALASPSAPTWCISPTAYAGGYSAGITGAPATVNPWNGQKAEDWLTGWRLGKRHYQQNEVAGIMQEMGR